MNAATRRLHDAIYKTMEGPAGVGVDLGDMAATLMGLAIYTATLTPDPTATLERLDQVWVETLEMLAKHGKPR